MPPDTAPVLPYSPRRRRPPDWRGRIVAVGCGLVAGIPVGLGTGAYHKSLWHVLVWYIGPIIAGLAVGAASALAARWHPVLLSLLGGVAVVAGALATDVGWLWYDDRWRPGGNLHTDLVWIGVLALGGLAGLLVVCVPAAVAAVLVVVMRRRAA